MVVLAARDGSPLPASTAFLIVLGLVFAVVAVSAFAEEDPSRHLVRLCFGKKDETIDAGVAAMARAKELLA